MLRFLKSVLELFLLVVLGGCTLGSLLGFLGQYHHIFELLSHFRSWFLGVQLASAVVFFFFNKKWTLACVILAVPALLSAWPYEFPSNRGSMDYMYTGGCVRLLNLNVLKSNREYNRVIDLFERENPDIIALQEPDSIWLQALSSALKRYPYRLEMPRDNNFGIALYSKIPLKNFQVKYFTGLKPDFPSILAEGTWQGHSFHILTTHPFPPMSGYALRNLQFEEIARQRAGWGNSLIVMGDLNTSQWSYYFQKLLKETQLQDTQLWSGVQLSCPADSHWIRIPIDHVLVSQEWKVQNRRLGPNVGSDHLPVIVDLSL